MLRKHCGIALCSLDKHINRHDLNHLLGQKFKIQIKTLICHVFKYVTKVLVRLCYLFPFEFLPLADELHQQSGFFQVVAQLLPIA